MDFALLDPKKEVFGPYKALECTRGKNLFLVKKKWRTFLYVIIQQQKTFGWTLLSIVMEQQRKYWKEIVKNYHGRA